MENFSNMKSKPQFSANQIVIRRNDLKREFCIRITSVLPGDESYRYRGSYTNLDGHAVTKIFDENEIQPAK